MTRKTITLISIIKNYINSKELYSVITRKQLFDECIKSIDFADTTLDSIRRMLTVTCYLEDYQRGQYKIIKRIPEDLTINRLRECAYPLK